MYVLLLSLYLVVSWNSLGLIVLFPLNFLCANSSDIGQSCDFIVEKSNWKQISHTSACFLFLLSFLPFRNNFSQWLRLAFCDVLCSLPFLPFFHLGVLKSKLETGVWKDKFYWKKSVISVRDAFLSAWSEKQTLAESSGFQSNRLLSSLGIYWQMWINAAFQKWAMIQLPFITSRL